MNKKPQNYRFELVSNVDHDSSKTSQPLPSTVSRSKIEKMLIVTDFSENAEQAEIRAAMLGTALNCRLLEIMAAKSRDFSIVSKDALGAIEKEREHDAEGIADIERGLRKIADRMNKWDKLPYVCSVRFGKPTTEILARAEMLPADLIIVGTHTDNFIANLFRGYSVAKLLRMSRRPLLVVKRPVLKPYQRVLVAVDFSEESREAALMALTMAPNADFTLIHVARVSFEHELRELGIPDQMVEKYRTTVVEEAKRKLDQFIAQLGTTSSSISRTIQYGLAVEEVLKYALNIRADLITMGKYESSWLEDRAGGAFTHDALMRAHCDLLVTPVPVNPSDWFDGTAA